MVKKLCSTIIMLVFIITSAGCIVAHGPRHQPPPPKQVRVKARKPGPNYFWITGHWEWRHGRYVWKQGHWKKTRKNRHWVSGHWKQIPRGWVWIKGHWR